MEYLTIDEVATYHQVKPWAVYNWCARGLLPRVRVDGRWCIPAEEARAFIKPRKGGPRQRPGYHVLTDAEVAEIRGLAGTMPQVEIARMYHVSEAAVSRIVRGERRCERQA